MRALMLAAVLSLAGAALAQTSPKAVPFTLIDLRGVGQPIGQVTFEETRWGLLITPELSHLPPGLHGFHVHQQPGCGPREKEGKTEAGLAAGGHFDPDGTKRHRGPYRESGHLGDLPALYVNAQGKADTPVLAPRLKLRDLAGRAIVIHEGGDNYEDSPQPLGGGGARIACAVVERR
jgi:Cu-Zn family superoxide dismutase